VRLSRPLDWLVIADHSDGMGLVGDIAEGKPELLAYEQAARWNKGLAEGGARSHWDVLAGQDGTADDRVVFTGLDAGTRLHLTDLVHARVLNRAARPGCISWRLPSVSSAGWGSPAPQSIRSDPCTSDDYANVLNIKPVITANFEAHSGNRWVVPVGGGIGRIFKVGNQLINASVKAYYNVKDTSASGYWAIVAQWAFLFPKGK
jgi:Protein of unknown function (DUF3604)